MGRARRAVVRPSRAVQTAGERRCKHCGSPLRGKGSQRYCNATCRGREFQARRRTNALEVLDTLKEGVAALELLLRQK